MFEKKLSIFKKENNKRYESSIFLPAYAEKTFYSAAFVKKIKSLLKAVQNSHNIYNFKYVSIIGGVVDSCHNFLF